jgi:hypothetical protein
MSDTPIITESEILADVMAANRGDLTPEAARSVLNWKFSRRTNSRIDKLAERNRQGAITARERQELERYLRVGSLINILQAKARLSLKSSES